MVVSGSRLSSVPPSVLRPSSVRLLSVRRLSYLCNPSIICQLSVQPSVRPATDANSENLKELSLNITYYGKQTLLLKRSMMSEICS